MSTSIDPTLSRDTVIYFRDYQSNDEFSNRINHLKYMVDSVINPRTERQQFWVDTAGIVAVVASITFAGACIWFSLPVFLGTSLATLTASGFFSLSAIPVAIYFSIFSIFCATMKQSCEQYNDQRKERLFKYVTDPRNNVNQLLEEIDNRLDQLFPKNSKQDANSLNTDKCDRIKIEVANTRSYLEKFVQNRFLANTSTTS